MGENPKTISRLELYKKKIWEIPITRLSKEYGLSDVGFAKICKKHNIPRPPRGYWAQKESGQQVPKVPLPKRSSDEIIEIRPYRSNRATSPMDPGILQSIEKYPPIIVPKSLRNPHPLIQQSQQILELSEPNSVGIVEPSDKNCLDIRVSRKLLPRTLRIMNALINALLERRFEVFQENSSLKVQIDNNPDTYNALSHALAVRRLDLIKLLVEHGAKVDSLDLVQVLLEAGAEITYSIEDARACDAKRLVQKKENRIFEVIAGIEDHLR